MASEVPEVKIETNTDPTDTIEEPVSLLDKLRSPTQSDLCRKRKVQTFQDISHSIKTVLCKTIYVVISVMLEFNNS